MSSNIASQKIMSLTKKLTCLHVLATWKTKFKEWVISLQTSVHDGPYKLYEGNCWKLKPSTIKSPAPKCWLPDSCWECPGCPTKNHLSYSPHVTKATTMGNSFTEILFNTLPFPQPLPAFCTVGSLETSSKPSPSWHIHDEQLQLLRHWMQLPWAVPLK